MKDAEFPYPVGADQVEAASCPHPVWVTRLRGGEPLSVSLCQLCGDVNWKQLREDLEVIVLNRDLNIQNDPLRIGPECFASEDGEVICWKGQNYIKQPDPRDTEERPEDAARRYAKQLLELKEGLQARGVNLDNICEDHLVKVVLECWDEAIGVIKRIGFGPSNA